MFNNSNCYYDELVDEITGTNYKEYCHIEIVAFSFAQTFGFKSNFYTWWKSLPPWRNRVKKLKTQSRIDSETQRNFETLRLCDFAS